MNTITDQLARRPDWEARLVAYLGRVARLGFRPGVQDCALFAAGAVHAMTGRDLAAGFGGKYRSLAAGRALLEAEGFADHVAFVAAALPEIAPSLAAPGDVVALPGDGDGAALGIVQGAGVYVMAPSGLAIVSRLHVERAFKV